MKTIRNTVLTLFVIYALVILSTYVLQRELIFAPSQERVLPSEVGLNNVDEITLTTSEGHELLSWYGKAKLNQPTILFFHGNGGSVSYRHEKFRQLMARGYGVFMLGYPGYGGSAGNPSEDAFMTSAQLAFDFLQDSGIGYKELIIYGESLGSAVAVQLAAKNMAQALILVAPMSSVREIAQMQYPFLPVGLLLKDSFLSLDYIDRVHMPVIVLHGSADSVIPMSSGRKLFEKANEPKVFHVIEGAGHNNLYDFPLVDALSSFIRDYG